MPALNPVHEDLFRHHAALNRILGLAICAGAPVTYVVVLVVAVLRGDPRPMLTGLGAVPFRDPVVLVLLVLSLQGFAAPLLVKRFFVPRISQAPHFEAALLLTRTATVIACALLETVAILGLVVAFLAGPAAAPLSLLMILATPAAYVAFVPGADTWRAALEDRTWA